MKAEFKNIATVKRFFPEAVIIPPTISGDWFYVSQHKDWVVGAYCIIGKGKTEDNAWKSAAKRLVGNVNA